MVHLNIILPSRLGSSEASLSPQVSPPQLWIHLFSPCTCYMHRLSPLRFPHHNSGYTYSLPVHAICTAYLVPDLITRTIFGEQYRSPTSSLCRFFHSSVTLSLLGPNNLLSMLFSDKVSLRSSLNLSDQVSHPYNTTRQRFRIRHYYSEKIYMRKLYNLIVRNFF